MSRPVSRATYLGLKPKPLVRKIKTKLAKMRRDIEDMAGAFEDVDQCLVNAGEELLGHFDEYQKELEDGLEYWAEQHEADA
jgi:hypothetical protein